MHAQDPVTAGPANSALTVGLVLRFLHEKFLRVLGISVAVTLPCFWHRRIEAGDLGSHTYNAWLSHLISSGQAPGLYLAHQWNNILLDVALLRVGNVVGLATAEKIVVPLCVLIFFWGAFAWIAAATEREPWLLVPALAMLAYGWTFQMGFLNYYLSLGLAFFSVSLFWRGQLWDRILALFLAGLALLGHPVGLLWLASTALYITLSRRLLGFWRCILFPIAVLAILATHFYVAHTYRTFDPVLWRVYLFSGPDQLVVYGHRYRIVAAFALLFAASMVLASFPEWRRTEFWHRVRTPLELWLLALFGTAMVWGDIVLPRYATGFTFLPQRVSILTAVLMLCVLGCLRPRKWHLGGLLLCGVIFFTWVYQDTAMLNHMERQVEHLADGFPYGTRVIPTIWAPTGWRIGVEHIVDRACIGRCFAYANYEPSSKQFRVRVAPEGSPIVVSSAAAGLAMREGRYRVQPSDLPLMQIYQCDQTDLSQLCIRGLTAGEVTGQAGYHAPAPTLP